MLFNQKVYGNDSFTERSIRGTEVIHVVLNKNSTSSDVFNYIKTNINPSYNGSVSSTTAYNKEKGGDMHWYIKNDDEEFMGVYFDGGNREGRDHFYEFVDLRWLGNGSAKMYFFWKFDTPDKKPNSKSKLIKGSHFLQTPAGKYIAKEIYKKLFKKVVKKVPSPEPFLLKVTTSAAKDVAIEKVFAVIEKIIENEPNTLELVNQIIIPIEEVAMGTTDVVDDIPILRNVVGLGLEIYQTYSTVTDAPTEMLRKTEKNFNSGVNNFQNSTGFLDHLGATGQIVASPFIGVGQATASTVIDVGYHLKDGFNKFFSWKK
ncbi:hypothetical protein [Candidatus Phytoplasma pruni]|uniref:Uncharacterized protein n=1 Tax=Candidatus Phytoplasma pruni TaxID=479893 RepID=A0A851HIE7_9MOLU|nr:hypothetical protein [Candidatus Phytoplasma pruni]NWN46074.1 hypothetical protein [Candidatus Phytoplasma pruni]